MPKLKKDMMNILDAKKRAENFVKFQDWIVNNKDAKQEAKLALAKINQKYNMMKIGE